LKPVKAILRRKKRENDGEEELNRGTIYTYMEMSGNVKEIPCSTIIYQQNLF
jgi:hypothetical protein